eukprot:scaffold1220_cov259-Pinguiococcus_pyrenoidosus.AAC.142
MAMESLTASVMRSSSAATQSRPSVCRKSASASKLGATSVWLQQLWRSSPSSTRPKSPKAALRLRCICLVGTWRGVSSVLNIRSSSLRGTACLSAKLAFRLPVR